MDVPFLIEKLVLVTVLFVITLTIAAYSTWAERKVAAWLQDRVGPNRAGIFGLLQPLADGGKMFFKEEIIPSGANKYLFIAGPSLALLVSFLGTAVIPFGSEIEIAGRIVSMQVTDINVGLLYIFGVVSLGVYGIMLGGWASNNKYSLMGAIRGASQNISYEIAMGLSIIALLLVTNTLSFGEIAAQQHGLTGILYINL
jgi:NADH-quinone oxidoreductase subunit H